MDDATVIYDMPLSRPLNTAASPPVPPARSRSRAADADAEQVEVVAVTASAEQEQSAAAWEMAECSQRRVCTLSRMRLSRMRFGCGAARCAVFTLSSRGSLNQLGLNSRMLRCAIDLWQRLCHFAGTTLPTF